MENKIPKYTVIRDTREQSGRGWQFEAKGRCEGTITQKMDEGDYTLVGWEKSLCIERKGSVSEFARNVTEKRFERELERMEVYDFPFMLLEFGMEHVCAYPVGSGIPQRQLKYLKFTGKYYLKRLTEFEVNYKTKIILCGNRGQGVARSIFNRMVEREAQTYE